MRGREVEERERESGERNRVCDFHLAQDKQPVVFLVLGVCWHGTGAIHLPVIDTWN